MQKNICFFFCSLFWIPKYRYLKFRHSEKATKVWKNIPSNIKYIVRFFQILWPSQNIWTLDPSTNVLILFKLVGKKNQILLHKSVGTNWERGLFKSGVEFTHRATFLVNRNFTLWYANTERGLLQTPSAFLILIGSQNSYPFFWTYFLFLVHIGSPQPLVCADNGRSWLPKICALGNKFVSKLTQHISSFSRHYCLTSR